MRICRNCNFLTKDDSRLRCPDCGEKTQEMSDDELYFYRQSLETQADMALRATMYQADRKEEIKRTPFSWICSVILILITVGFAAGLFMSVDLVSAVFPVCVVLAVNGCCLWPLLAPSSFAQKLTTDREIDGHFMNRIFITAFAAAIILNVILSGIWMSMPHIKA